MYIWIDNDGCAKIARELILRAAQRLQIEVKIVANHYMQIPAGVKGQCHVVDGRFDAADDFIADHVQVGDLVITSDIPLAARIVAAGAIGLNQRGEIFDAANINERLATRNLLQELRSAGDVRGGPPAYSEQDKRQFANALDRLLTKLNKK